MKKSFELSALALSISALLIPFTAHSAPTPSLTGTDTITWTGDGSPYNDALIEKSNVSGTGIHNMIVDNVDLISFTSGYNYSSMYYKAAVSLAGGNGLLSSSTFNYGDLSLKAVNSSITGSTSGNQLTGLYARSDSLNATISIESNSLIDLGYSNGNGVVLGILAESKSTDSLAEIKLSDGSDITITNNSGANAYNGSSAVLAYSELGQASVTTERDTTITTNGYGVDGIRTYSKTGSTVSHQGKITTNGGGSSAINTFGVVGTGAVNVINGSTGIIEVNGANSNGIKAYNAGSGGIGVQNDGTITLGAGATSSSAIFVQGAAASGDIDVINNGAITLDSAYSHAINVSGNSGTSDVTVVNQSAILVRGANSSAVSVFHNGTGTASFVNNGTIELDASASGSGAISVENTAVGGNVYVENNGSVAVNGDGSTAIKAVTRGDGNVKVINAGLVSNVDGVGIYARSSYGRTTEVYASGNITTGQLTAGSANHGIYAAADFGDTTVRYDAGTIKVGADSIGIVAADCNSGNHWLKNEITLGSSAQIDARQGLGGLLLQANGGGTINIVQGAEVHGGGVTGVTKGYGVKFDGLANSSSSPLYTDYKLNNDGFIDAMSDWAIVSDSAAGTTLEVNNNGSIYGYFTFGDENTTFNNLSSQSWNIRNFADIDGDLNRDEKGVAITNFGNGNDIFNNTVDSAIRLSLVNGESNVVTTGQYLTSGALSIANAGTVQGQLLNLNTFNNSGLIDLSENRQAGDLLAISANNNLSGTSIYEGGSVSSGGGQFVSEGGMLILDTVLNEGGANALSDVLVIDNAVAGSGATQIVINQVGGVGRVTDGDGIQLVNVLGNADEGSFTLSGNALKAGAYEYTLHQGSLSDPTNNSLYLRATAQQINPDVGAYLANQTAATGLFMHSLHDRLGEPQFYQNNLTESDTVPALWLRSVVSKTKGEAAGNSLKQDSDNLVVHLGGEVANWTGNGNDRYHLGVMGAYGRSETKTNSKAIGSKANSTVDGYGVGSYLTWYSNPASPEGWYADVWGMYSWFNNETDSSADYDSKSWTASLELGYATQLKALDNYNWMLEPQGQLAYHHYSSSGIKDANGMSVSDSDANGVSTRLGVRTYLRPSNNQAKVQPFLTLNWLHNSADNRMNFNGENFASDMPSNRFETKIGVQAEVVKNLQLYSHAGAQFGKDSYKHYEGQIGLRYRF